MALLCAGRRRGSLWLRAAVGPETLLRCGLASTGRQPPMAEIDGQERDHAVWRVGVARFRVGNCYGSGGIDGNVGHRIAGSIRSPERAGLLRPGGAVTDAVTCAGLDDPQIVPLPDGRLAEHPLPTKRDRGAAIVVAAVAPSKSRHADRCRAALWSVDRPRRSAAAVQAVGEERATGGQAPRARGPVGRCAGACACGASRKPASACSGRQEKPERARVDPQPRGCRARAPMSGRWTDPLAWPDERRGEGRDCRTSSSCRLPTAA